MANKSVYNFVPAPREKDVFKPSWAKQVSMDIPFENAQSGIIEITIEAMNPLYIRNGHSQKKTEEEKKDPTFSNYVDKDGKTHYFIPGTSLKGMFRNVFEIMSKSRLNKKLVNDHRYSYRDLTPNSLYLKKYKSNDINCGMLFQNEDGSWVIEDCGKPKKIKHKDINDLFEDENVRYWQALDKNSNRENLYRTALSKYRFLSKYGSKTIPSQVIYNDEDYDLVVTGQVQLVDYNARKSFAKKNEFLFPVLKDPEEYPISKQMQKDFRFIYREDKNDESEDWKYWRKELENTNNGVPVFFTLQNDEIAHFGLAYMYKLPYKNSIHEVFPLKDYKDEKDLTETLFGYTTDVKNELSLKGRVAFGHAKAINDCKPLPEVQLILGGPKASFFPYYLEQNRYKNGVLNYMTYEDDNAELRGFKRYPTRDSILKMIKPEKVNEKVYTTFKPLDRGAKFKSKIHFFNLKQEELGALLSAITLHGDESAFHSLGMAKPYGYGKVKVSINRIIANEEEINSASSFIEVFDSMMGGSPMNDASVKEFMAMATNKNESHLGYEELKKFQKMKKDKVKLPKFSELK